jgi:hypothetical protein
LKTKNVSILKKLIKEENARLLARVDAKDLELFQASHDDAEETFETIGRQPLDYLSLLSELFPFVQGNRLHIGVEVPAEGELI